MYARYEADVRAELTISRMLEGGGAVASTETGDAVYIAPAAVALFCVREGDVYEARVTPNRRPGGFALYAARLSPTRDTLPEGLRDAVLEEISDRCVHRFECVASAACARLGIELDRRMESFTRSILEGLYEDGLARKAVILDRGKTEVVAFSLAPAAELDVVAFDEEIEDAA